MTVALATAFFCPLPTARTAPRERPFRCGKGHLFFGGGFGSDPPSPTTKKRNATAGRRLPVACRQRRAHSPPPPMVGYVRWTATRRLILCGVSSGSLAVARRASAEHFALRYAKCRLIRSQARKYPFGRAFHPRQRACRCGGTGVLPFRVITAFYFPYHYIK